MSHRRSSWGTTHFHAEEFPRRLSELAIKPRVDHTPRGLIAITAWSRDVFATRMPRVGGIRENRRRLVTLTPPEFVPFRQFDLSTRTCCSSSRSSSRERGVATVIRFQDTLAIPANSRRHAASSASRGFGAFSRRFDERCLKRRDVGSNEREGWRKMVKRNFQRHQRSYRSQVTTRIVSDRGIILVEIRSVVWLL